MSNEVRQETEDGTLAGRERERESILGNTERMNGKAGRDEGEIPVRL